MPAEESGHPGNLPGSDDRRAIGGYRWASIGVGIVVAALAIWGSRHQYFRWDEWAYWTTRQNLLDSGTVKGIVHFFLQPHGGTLSAGIMLLWVPIDWVFGMHAYLPYVIPALVAHLVAGLLLFELLVSRLRPGVALATSGIFLVMGHAASGISYGWMVGFNYSLAAGFLALIAILRLERRNEPLMATLTVLAVVTALSFSAVGIAVAFIVTLAYALRGRFGWAATHLAAAAGPYVLWRAVYQPPALDFRLDQMTAYLSFMWDGFTTTAADLLRVPGVAFSVLLLIGALVGALWSHRRGDPLAFVYISTVAGALFFYALVAVRGVELDPRAFSADTDRYLYVAGALLLPSLAWLADRVVSARARAAVPLLILVVWAGAANLHGQLTWYGEAEALGQANRRTIETAAGLVDRLGSLEKGILVADESARISVAQLERLARLGKLPCSEDFTAAEGFAKGRGLGEIVPEDVSCG
ncbi:MAG: hypothetical protein V3U50_01055 [Acidimicrobiia bacterium]